MKLIKLYHVVLALVVPVLLACFAYLFLPREASSFHGDTQVADMNYYPTQWVIGLSIV